MQIEPPLPPPLSFSSFLPLFWSPSNRFVGWARPKLSERPGPDCSAQCVIIVVMRWWEATDCERMCVFMCVCVFTDGRRIISSSANCMCVRSRRTGFFFLHPSRYEVRRPACLCYHQSVWATVQLVYAPHRLLLLLIFSIIHPVWISFRDSLIPGQISTSATPTSTTGGSSWPADTLYCMSVLLLLELRMCWLSIGCLFTW